MRFYFVFSLKNLFDSPETKKQSVFCFSVTLEKAIEYGVIIYV